MRRLASYQSPHRERRVSKKSPTNKQRSVNENYPRLPKKINVIIIKKKKKAKPAPKTYAERAEWLRNKAGQTVAGKRKVRFTPQDKRAITLLFAGKKKIITVTRKIGGKTKKIKQTIHSGGLYQWRDSHNLTITSDKQRAALVRQKIKISQDTAFIPRRQKSERVRINNDGSRTRYIGQFRQKTYPLTIAQIGEMMDDPENAAVWLEQLVGHGNTFRLEFVNGFGGQEETLHDLLNSMTGSKGFLQAGVLEKIIGIMVETRVKHVKKKRRKKSRKR